MGGGAGVGGEERRAQRCQVVRYTSDRDLFAGAAGGSLAGESGFGWVYATAGAGGA